MSGAHAVLSPSGAHRWMPCPGSVALERGLPDNPNDYSDEGTCAHKLATMALGGNKDPHAYVGRRIDLGHRTWEVDEEMADEVQKYLGICKALAVNGESYMEVSVPIGHITGEEGATGTADFVVVDEKQRELIVVDLKYGKGVPVFARDNPQLQLYALGVYDREKLVQDFDQVRVIISQPRLDNTDEWTYTIDEMEEFRVRAQTRAVVAFGFREASIEDTCAKAPDGTFAFLHPGDEQCKFCKAKPTCPAAAARVQDAVGADFDVLAADPKKLVTETIPESADDIGVKMDVIDYVESWCKAVRSKVETLLLQGVAVGSPGGGYKLVLGRQGNRKWTEDKDAEKILKGFRLKSEQIYHYKLISPTDAEKLLEKSAPKRWAKLTAVITRADASKSVAPMADKRPAISVLPPADDFEVLSAESDLI